MISGEMDKLYPSAKTLVKECVWVDLASNPPCSLQEIQSFADYVVADGINTVVLIGQGGSTQAPMTADRPRRP